MADPRSEYWTNTTDGAAYGCLTQNEYAIRMAFPSKNEHEAYRTDTVANTVLPWTKRKPPDMAKERKTDHDVLDTLKLNPETLFWKTPVYEHNHRGGIPQETQTPPLVDHHPDYIDYDMFSTLMQHAGAHVPPESSLSDKTEVLTRYRSNFLTCIPLPDPLRRNLGESEMKKTFEDFAKKIFEPSSTRSLIYELRTNDTFDLIQDRKPWDGLIF